jgi:hypothetical protein
MLEGQRGSGKPGCRGESEASIRMLYTNACSINNKWGEVEIAANDFAIIAVTETWLSRELDVAEALLRKFTAYRVDRDDGRTGGGALLLVEQSLRQVAGRIVCLPNIQLVSCILETNKGQLLVLCLYRSPIATETEDDTLLTHLYLECRSHNKVLIVGDFKAPEID